MFSFQLSDYSLKDVSFSFTKTTGLHQSLLVLRRQDEIVGPHGQHAAQHVQLGRCHLRPSGVSFNKTLLRLTFQKARLK